MKKLTLILSTLLLMSSTAAFARSKVKQLNVDMGDNQTCLHGKKALENISQLRTVSFSGKCIGSNLKGKIRVHYLVRARQKFEIEVAYRRDISRAQMSYNYARALEMVDAPGISIIAWPDQEHGPAFADTYYLVKGKISLK